MLAYANSCSNPILYAFFSLPFRKAFTKLFLQQEERPECGTPHAEARYGKVMVMGKVMVIFMVMAMVMVMVMFMFMFMFMVMVMVMVAVIVLKKVQS